LIDGQRRISGIESGGTKPASPYPRLATTTQLEAFLEVVEQRSYTLAARWLEVSQPNVHRAVRDLERFLGQKLFQISPQGVEPGAASRRFAQSVGLAFSEIEHGLDELAERRGNHRSTVAVGCLPLGRVKILPTAVTRLLEIYPLARVKIADGAFAGLLDELMRGKVDVILGALRIPPPAAGLVQETLFLEPLSAVVRAGHPLIKRTSLDARALGKLDWIVPHERAPARAQFEGYFRSRKVKIPTRLIECSSLAATRGLLMQSDRAALLSASQVQDEVRKGELVIVPVQLSGTERPIGLCYREDWLPTKVQARFLALIREVALD
jgi:DNA-binding transcriptional LysR family regulator